MNLVLFWVSSFFQSGLFWLVSIFISKKYGVESLGEFSYALAIISPLVILSGLQLRHFSLTQNDLSIFKKSKSLRLTNSSIVFIILVGWSYFFSRDHFQIITLIALVKIFESWSDLCFGWLQHQENLGKIAALQILKYALPSILLFGALFFTTQLSFFSFLVCFSLYFVITAVVDYFVSGFHQLGWGWQIDQKMIKTTFYLSLASLLTSFSVNIPRYFLEHFVSLSEVAIFSAFFYFYLIPQLGFNYLNIALLKKMSTKLNARMFTKIFCALSVLGILCFFIFQLFGGQLLRLLYSIEQEWSVQHSWTLAYLVFISGLVSFLYYYLLSSKIYEIQIKANVVSLVVTIVASWYFIPRLGVIGGLYSLVLANTFLAGIYFYRYLIQQRKSQG